MMIYQKPKQKRVQRMGCQEALYFAACEHVLCVFVVYFCEKNVFLFSLTSGITGIQIRSNLSWSGKDAGRVCTESCHNERLWVP